ncbi:hypothetical protein JF66_12925 [Cryobacterium sp. MLB-32]|nr:hypothetical protein JF66_12925 [Cryobacterium sp. MLB-32]
MWRLIMAALAVCGVALLIGAGAILVLVVTHESQRVVPSVYIIPATFVVSYLLLHWASKQKDKECAAGYTTSPGGYPNLEQVDASTGLIVRAAGESLIGRKEQRARVQAFKATLVDS